MQMSPRTKRVSSEEINAPPESGSSDEEEASIPFESSPAPNLRQIFEDIGKDAQTGGIECRKELKGGVPQTQQRQPQLQGEDIQLPSPPPFSFIGWPAFPTVR